MAALSLANGSGLLDGAKRFHFALQWYLPRSHPRWSKHKYVHASRRRVHRQDRLLPERAWSYDRLFDVPFQPSAMTVDELEIAFRPLV
jgi:hypothetical protein